MKLSRAITLAVAALANQAAAAIPITGATTGLSGGVPVRHNIVDLFNEGGPQWTLYVRALSAMMEADSDDPESYFQISGIHGRPVIAWDSNDKPKMQMGYCPHAENIFLPWHRSYLALFEQILVDHAIEIAAEYNDPAFTAAAETLRMPYWDWAEDPTVPAFAGDVELTVRGPKGPKKLANPLHSYEFSKKAVDGKYGRIIGGNRDPRRTSRCAPAEANKRLSEVNLKGMVYDAFTRSNTFEKVGSMGSSGVVVSFEQPHNSIHMRAGCGSHFAFTQEGAFDPLFMLHHTNVDRLWAMWEELYPSQKVMNPPYKSAGTFAISAGTVLDASSAMLPFFGPGDVAHTAEFVKDVATFGYTYSELPSSGSPDARRRSVISLVNKLYGRGSQDEDDPPASSSIPVPTLPGPSPTSAAVSSSAVVSSSVAFSSSSAVLPTATSLPARLPGVSETDISTDLPTSLPVAESLSIPASVPTDITSSDIVDGIPTTIAESIPATLTGFLPTATLSSPAESTPSGPSFPSFPGDDTEYPEDNGYPEDGDSGYPEVSAPGYPEVSAPSYPELDDDKTSIIPDLSIDIGRGIDYFVHLKVKTEKLPTPCEINVFVGGKFAGSFAIISAPPTGFIEGGLPIRKVLGFFGLLKGVIADLIAGKIRDPIDAIMENIQIEIIAPDGKVINSELPDTEYEVSIDDVAFVPPARADELPTFGKPRRTGVKPQPAPPRPGKCASRRRAVPGDLAEVMLR